MARCTELAKHVVELSTFRLDLREHFSDGTTLMVQKICQRRRSLSGLNFLAAVGEYELESRQNQGAMLPEQLAFQ